MLSSLIRRLWFPALLTAVVLTTGPIIAAQTPQAPSAESAAFFRAEVKPVLERVCLTCHAGEKPAGGLTLTSRVGILKGGQHGPIFNLLKPSESKLIRAVNYLGPQMPPTGKLPQREIDALTRWVKMGLPWPSSEKVTIP